MKTYFKTKSLRKFFYEALICLFAYIILFSPCVIEASEWKAGIASIVITPEEPVWMAGYSGRKEPSQGKIHDLYVKALALEDSEGNRVVITTADLIGVSRDFSNSVSQEIFKRFGLPREVLLFNTSHTHCGPEVRFYKKSFYDIPEKYLKKIDSYTKWLEKKYIEVISKAISDMKPAGLSFSSANPTPFAVSRRLPSPEGIIYRSGPSSYYTGGSRDDVVPVLKVTDTAGNIKGILFGYACHPITLRRNQLCGDYPGFAQCYIEELYPGATAFFVQGCSGELVPNARYQVEYAMGHGKSLAEAVKKALDGEQISINGQLKCAYDEVTLDFQPVPERKILEENLNSNNTAIRHKSAFLLEKLDKNVTIETTLPCPLQVIRFGKELLLIGLCGEPVADYAVKLKSEFLTHKFVWVAGYCNYEFGYLPTWKVLMEGGYEGGGAMVHMPFPGPFTETVEKRVLEGVHRLVKSVSD
ncbi:hypothetical protein ES707_08528 [subsurface metagenome]